jgi:hypothetical protein
MHDEMQHRLREWALARGLPLVDAIELLDPHRHLMVSWVHLHPEANTMVAEAFAAEILESICPR